MKSTLFLLLTVSGLMVLSSPLKLNEIKKYRSVNPAGKVILERGFERIKNINNSFPSGFKLVNGAGRNGTIALLYKRSNPKAYKTFDIKLPQLSTKSNYQAEVYVRGENIVNHGDDKYIGGFCVEYYKNGKWNSGFYYKLTSLKNEWQHLVLPVTAKAGMDTIIKLYMRRKYTGKIWFDDLKFTTSGTTAAVLLTSPDRLTFKGESGKFILHVSPDLSKDIVVYAVVENEGKKKELLLKGDNHFYRGDAGKLKPGEVKITAKLIDLKGKRVIYGEVFNLKAVPRVSPPLNACLIDKYGRALINGKPFMPLGIFGSANVDAYKKIAASGFNCIQLYGSLKLNDGTSTNNPVKDISRGLDLINKYGLKVIFSLKDQYPGMKYAVKKLGDAKTPTMVAEKAVRSFKDHPAILAWYINDEKQRTEIPQVVELRRKVSCIDPWHPTWSLTYRYGDFPYYGISGDIVGVDPYPIRGNRPQSLGMIKEAMTAANKTGLPCWVVPQIFNWAVYSTKTPEVFRKTRFPTEEEIRTMPLMEAIYGAKGFVFYSYFDIAGRAEKLLPGTFAKEWPKVVKVVKLLKELEPYIMSTRPIRKLKVDCHPAKSVEAAVLTADNGKSCMVIVATEEKARGTITFDHQGKFRSKYGLTAINNDKKFEFTTEKISSDVIFFD